MDADDDFLFLEWEDDSLLLFDEKVTPFQSSIGNQNVNQTSQGSIKRENFLQQVDEDFDYAFALTLQNQYEAEIKENIISDSKKPFTKESQSSKALSIVDEQWELLDPHPDIYALFQSFDKKFFYGTLKHVEVKWSKRMTSCAGVCSYEGRGGLCSVRLSEPLLKLRPRKDLIETLLHEMIHAYLFVTNNNKDRTGHGPEFLSHMHRINKESGTRITVFHSFHDEVELYRTHWWKCDGPCKNRHPYYGLVKRSRNCAPGPNDFWWANHQASCGGTFIKIKEPDNSGKKKTTKRKATPECTKSAADIRSFFKDDVSQTDKKSAIPSPAKSNISPLESSSIKGNSIATLSNKSMSPKKLFVPFQGSGYKLGGSMDGFDLVSSRIKVNAAAFPTSSENALNTMLLPNISKVPKLCDSQKYPYKDEKPSTSIVSGNRTKSLVQSPIERFFSSDIVTHDSSSGKKDNFIKQFNDQKSDILKVSCPVCSILVKEQDINSHLDTCISS